MSQGSFTIFVTRPLSAVMLGVAFLVLLSAIFPYFRKQRQKYEEYQESAE
jgi:TctA family transporter